MPESGKVIALVDDEQETLTRVTKLLTVNGYQVTAYPHSAQLIRDFMTEQLHFDLLLTDMDLGPTWTGAELIRTLRANGCTKPMILWSGGQEIDKISTGGDGPTIKIRKRHEGLLIRHIRRLLGQA